MHNPIKTDENQLFLVMFPKSCSDYVIIPGMANLSFNIKLSSAVSPNTALVSNIGRAIVKTLAVKFEGNKTLGVDDFGMSARYQALESILVLLQAEKLFARDTSRFYNPKIEKVSVNVEGKPSQLYIQGMRSFKQYDEICRYFTEEKQCDANVNETQKHLQFHDLSVGEYVTDKYAVCRGLMA